MMVSCLLRMRATRRRAKKVQPLGQAPNRLRHQRVLATKARRMSRPNGCCEAGSIARAIRVATSERTPKWIAANTTTTTASRNQPAGRPLNSSPVNSPAVSGALFARRSDAVARVLGRWTDAAAAVTTVVVLGIILTAPPVAGALALLGLAASYGVVQPRLLAAVAERVQDGPATAIGTANLLLLLGGGIGSAMVGGLGRTMGGIVLLVLVGLVMLATVREAVAMQPLRSQPN